MEEIGHVITDPGENTLAHRETETRYTTSTPLHFLPHWEVDVPLKTLGVIPSQEIIASFWISSA